MAITIKQIAAAAGVSRGTVDRVLHNRGGVRQEVEDHIREIAARMGYLPNRAGKMLAARKQPITIGYVLPSIGNLFFEDVKKGIQSGAAEMKDFGMQLKIAEVRGFYPDIHIEAIHNMAKQGINVLCVSSADTPEVRACINSVIQSGIPVVTVNTDLSGTERMCFVGTDFVMAGRTAAGLLTLYRIPDKIKLLVATGSLEVKGHNDRIYGFQQIFDQKKIEYELLELYETQDDDDIAYQKTCEMLQKHPDVNCIYITAAGVPGVCQAVDNLPSKRKKSIRVICFDDIVPVRKYLKKGILDFMVCQEPILQGYQSVIKLFNYFLDGGKGKLDHYITKAVIKINENMDKH